MKYSFKYIPILGVILLFFLENSILGHYVSFNAEIGTEVIFACEEPPLTLVESVIPSSPGPEYAWVEGNWKWHGHWIWSKGRWVHKPFPEASWNPGSWEKKHQHWVWIEGSWH